RLSALIVWEAFYSLHDANLSVEGVFGNRHSYALSASDPAIDRVSRVFQGFFTSGSLCQAAGKTRNFDDPAAVFVIRIEKDLSHGYWTFRKRIISTSNYTLTRPSDAQ